MEFKKNTKIMVLISLSIIIITFMVTKEIDGGKREGVKSKALILEEINKNCNKIKNMNLADGNYTEMSDDEKIKKCIFNLVLKEKGSIERKITYLNYIQSGEYAVYCHPLTHELGEYYVNKGFDYKNLIKIKIESCNDGFNHGVFVGLKEKININERNSLIPLYKVCEMRETHLKITSCIHGIGHLIYKYYKDGEIKEENMFEYCKEYGGDLYIHTCAAGIEMDKMQKQFYMDEVEFNNCYYKDIVEKVACLQFPKLSPKTDPVKSKNTYCKNFQTPEERRHCEFGIINGVIVVNSTDEILNYCLEVSTDKEACLHHLLHQLPISKGMGEYERVRQTLIEEGIQFREVTEDEITTGTDAMINENYINFKIDKLNDKK